jgi:hypothetical protein
MGLENVFSSLILVKHLLLHKCCSYGKSLACSLLKKRNI